MSLRHVVAVAVLTFAGSAQAGILYTVRTSDRMLRTINTETLAIHNVGLLGVSFDFGGLAWDGGAGKMYMVQGFAGNGLYEVDLGSGAASFIGTHGFTDMFGLAWDPTSGTLYGSRSTTGSGLYTFNTSNGSASVVGDPVVWLDGLAYDTKRGELIGGYAGPGDIYKVDTSDASVALLNDGDFFNNAGMAYDADTDLFWLIDWSGNLYSIDPNAGYSRTLQLSGLGAHDGLELGPVPAPASISVLVGLAAIGCRRRQR